MNEDQFRYVRSLQEKNKYLYNKHKKEDGWSLWEVLFACSFSFLLGVVVSGG
jgi:hypothetical protein